MNGFEQYWQLKLRRLLYWNWKQWPAYKMGIIDEDGNFLREPEGSEKIKYNFVDDFIRRVKIIIQKYVINRSLHRPLFLGYLMKSPMDHQTKTFISYKSIEESIKYQSEVVCERIYVANDIRNAQVDEAIKFNLMKGHTYIGDAPDDATKSEAYDLLNFLFRWSPKPNNDKKAILSYDLSKLAQNLRTQQHYRRILNFFPPLVDRLLEEHTMEVNLSQISIMQKKFIDNTYKLIISRIMQNRNHGDFNINMRNVD